MSAQLRTASLALLFAASASAQDAPAPAAPPAPEPAPAPAPAPAPVLAPALRKPAVPQLKAAQRKAVPAPGQPLAPALAAAPAAPPATSPTDRDPPGAVGALPTTMDKIASAADVPFKPQPGGHLVKFNLQDADLAELVNHISGLTGKRFIYGAKVRQIKATVVSPEPVTLEEAYQAFLSILDANGMTVVPHGRFLKIIDSGGVVTQPTPVIARGEPVPDSDRFITRLYRLEHVSSDEAMALLGKFKSKDGDISVYGPGRLLIITDTATQVRRLIRIVEEIDVGGSGQHMWIEPVHNGNAQELAKRVNELFDLGSGGAAAPGGAPGAPGANNKASGLNKVIPDEQTNSLIVVGTEDSYLRLLEVLKRLDSQSTETGKIHVLPLQHAIAEEMSQTLNQMLGGAGAAGARGAPPPAGGAPGGAVSGTFEGELRVTADKSTNSLIITSSNRDYATMRLVVDKLDHARRQVFIEAVIMDLAVSDSTTMGMSFHGGDVLGAQKDTLLLGGFQAGKSIGFPADPSLLQGFAAGVRGPALPNTTNILGTGLSVPEFGVVLNAVASSGRSNVLATPHIIATDNVAAEINIGENIPLQTNVGGGASPLAGLAGGAGATAGLGLLGGLGGLGGFAAPRQDVGNKIKVTPHINESNQVRLEIDQESSAPGATSGTLGAVSITKRTANTTVVVQDQQTVVIGGLMSDSYVTSRTKVPILGDLPLLGALFRTSDVQKQKKNLLLVLTPHVIRDQEDLRKIFERKIQERQEFLDRYMVFSGEDWRPPHDWSRTSGLVEDIRKAFAEIAEQERLEAESKPRETPLREPSEPIELPGDVQRGGAAAPVGSPDAQRRGRPPGSLPAPAAAPAAPAPAAPPPAQPQGDNEPPFRINPIARSVNVDRVE
ncbi:MAG TPA: type II secretion system secretin GspD [Polyangiaceae bacterium]|nr:type II secretion system secretin GspD [Polyangiaceae bacterium]